MSGSTSQNKIVPVAEKKKVQLIAAFPVPGIHHKSFEILCMPIITFWWREQAKLKKKICKTPDPLFQNNAKDGFFNDSKIAVITIISNFDTKTKLIDHFLLY